MNTIEKKAGYKSTEFWMSIAAVAVGALTASGLIDESELGARVVGLITATLVALGYTGSRLTLKKHAIDAQVKLNGDTNSNPEGNTETSTE
jgi:hypothetical protein